MVANKTKVDRIHDQMPRFFKTRVNPNWKALVEALGESDENLTDLVEEVRKQFFIKTASRPYLDRLGSNFKVSRPKLVGMDDPTFRNYIPVLSYQPKQVKLILDLLLDIFFFKESTTAFTQSTGYGPFSLSDGWELEYIVDGSKREDIVFDAADFVDISNASAEEVAGAINRGAQHSFAVVFDDRIQKRKFIRIFTNTIGSKGSIQIVGGRANIDLQFRGFNSSSGSGVNTTWSIVKVGDTMTFTHTGGQSPGLDKVQVGDIVIVAGVPDNEGSFVITEVDVGAGSFSFVNLLGSAIPFGEPGYPTSFDHSTDPESYIRFLTPEKIVVYTNDNRALVWEVSPGEIIVEIPASPPVVKRILAGSAHINGFVSSVVDRVSETEIELDDASDWPLNGGKFVLQQQQEIQTHILTDSEDTIVSQELESRFDKRSIYSYTSKVGNNLTGITPDLPFEAEVFEHAITTLNRLNGTVTVNTATDHGFSIGEFVKVQNTVSAASTVGIRVDISSSDSDAVVATKTAARINAEADFSASAILNQVTVTNAANGTATDAADVDAGVSVLVSQQGTAGLPETTQVDVAAGSTYDVVGTGLRWEISSANDAQRYHVWYNVTDGANVQSNIGLENAANGTFLILDTPTTTSFTYTSVGENGSATGGLARVERIGMSSDGSLVYLTSAQLGTGILGPNIWDENASFVLSSLTSNIQQEIRSGNNVRTLQIDPINNIPNEEGFAVFSFGTENEEGPVRYLYKPTDASMQLDPAYVFKNNHDIGDSVTVIRRRGAHVISGTGKEIAPYITDPAVAREVLQELVRQTKSVGIFINFLIRFPEQLYSVLDVYGSGNEDLYPILDTE